MFNPDTLSKMAELKRNNIHQDAKMHRLHEDSKSRNKTMRVNLHIVLRMLNAGKKLITKHQTISSVGHSSETLQNEA